MSCTEERLRCLASPERARSLLTVRAAISSALSSFSPRSRRPSLMCSYWRSRFAFHARWGIAHLLWDRPCFRQLPTDAAPQYPLPSFGGCPGRVTSTIDDVEFFRKPTLVRQLVLRKRSPSVVAVDDRDPKPRDTFPRWEGSSTRKERHERDHRTTRHSRQHGCRPAATTRGHEENGPDRGRVLHRDLRRLHPGGARLVQAGAGPRQLRR